MSRRERMENRMQRRLEWAGKAEARSDSRFKAAGAIADNIPLGQPILVGHYSERHARRDQERIHSNMSAGVAESHLAKHHLQKADGIASQLEHTIYSDDGNAIDALEKRIAENEAKRDRRKSINRMFKKGDAAGLEALGLTLEKLRSGLSEFPSHDRQPYPAYSLTNLGARIRADRERIAVIKARSERTEKAEANGGVVIEGDKWIRVTFAEKPDCSVLDALRAAGFRWGQGSWIGQREKLPEGLQQSA